MLYFLVLLGTLRIAALQTVTRFLCAVYRLFSVCIFVQYLQIKSKCAQSRRKTHIKKISSGEIISMDKKVQHKKSILKAAAQPVKNIVLNLGSAGREERRKTLVPYGRSVKAVIFTVNRPQELIIAQLAESLVVYLLGALPAVSVPLSDLLIVQPVKIILPNYFPQLRRQAGHCLMERHKLPVSLYFIKRCRRAVVRDGITEQQFPAVLILAYRLIQ